MASPGFGTSDSVWRGAIFMLNTLLLPLALGFLLGFLAGLGIGGGSLLMLWLTLVLNTPYPTARAINLLFFLAAAGSVCFYRSRRGRIAFKAIIPAILGGCVAAGICSWIGSTLKLDWIRKLFGILLLLTGLREIFYRPRKAK